jgi:hypothetical protein
MLPLVFFRKNPLKSATNRTTMRDRRSRRLVLESLEDRRLLTIIDMAAIAGTLFYELPGRVQQPVLGETVSFYEDDGDGVFNSVLDTLKTTDVSDLSGNYRFDSLTAGTYFIVTTVSSTMPKVPTSAAAQPCSGTARPAITPP